MSYNLKIDDDIKIKLLELQGMKQIVTKKRVSSVGEIIRDLLGLKEQLPYNIIAPKKLDLKKKIRKPSRKKNGRNRKKRRK